MAEEKKLETKSALNKYYEKELYLSYSALNLLLFSPAAYFKKYVLEEEEEKSELYLLEGKLIHCLLLEETTFNDKYVISPVKLPTDNTKKVVDEIFKIYQNSISLGVTPSQSLSSYDHEICEILKLINLHQSLKSDIQRVEKIVTPEAESYWNFLITIENKTVIDPEVYNRCKESVEAIRKHPEAADLIGLHLTEMDNVKVFNEIYLDMKLASPYTFGLKGHLDSLKIDSDKKIIYINDLKKTNKTIPEFKESIDYYRYWMQASIYNMLVLANFPLKPGWKLQFNFIVIDRFQQVYTFEVSDVTMLKWTEDTLSKLDEFSWHYTNKRFDLPYDYASKKVIL